MFNLNEFAKEVHENAKAHGWWDSNRDVEEIIALIHSEWSEALEEYRAGRALVWFQCNESNINNVCHPCNPKDETDCLYVQHINECMHRGRKPEGIAIELIDGCIRILDFAGKRGVKLTFEGIEAEQRSLTSLIADLHYYTAMAQSSIGRNGDFIDTNWIAWLGAAIFESFRYITAQGLDPYDLMKLKHEYNKTRPYKHGKVC